MATHENQQGLNEFFTFLVDNERYAVNQSDIIAVREWEKVRSLPLSDDYLKGLIHNEGELIPVIDLNLKFGLSEKETTEDTSIVILKIEESNKRKIAMIVDKVTEVKEIEENLISPWQSIENNQTQPYILGTTAVDKDLVIILNQANLMDITSCL